MAADKFLYNNAGVITEKAGATTAVANAIPALDATGRLGTAQMPVGIGPEVKVMKASGAIAAGDFVNVFNDTGTLKARKADASTTGKEANGYVLAVYADGEDATVYGLGGQINSQVTGKTLGARQYLSSTAAGGTQETAPTTAGYIVQLLGKAVAATEIMTENHDYIVVA
jgi:hypothetical protein